MMQDDFSPEAVRAALAARSDPKLRAFSQSLTPGCTDMMGVRVPVLREYAKRLARLHGSAPAVFDEYKRWALSGGAFHEEKLIFGMAIGYLKADIADVFRLLDEFMPINTNWAVNDSVCVTLKAFQKRRREAWDFLRGYARSGKTYYARMAVVCFLAHFVSAEWMLPVFDELEALDCSEYYVSMAAAWCVSVFFTAFPAEGMAFLQRTRIDDATFNRAVQKILESFRCPAELKPALRAMKRK